MRHNTKTQNNKPGFNTKRWRRMSPPARQTLPLQTMVSLARQGAATERSEGAKVNTVLDEVAFPAI